MRLRSRLVAIAVVVVVVGAGGYAYADARAGGTAYRTAVATRGDVERTLSETGTVAAAGRRDLAFGTSGTVSKVLVRQGQQVKKGAVLARLDDTDLHDAVVSAEATLAKARAQLVSDESATSSSTSSGASTSSSSATSSGSSSTGTGGSGRSGGGSGGSSGGGSGGSGTGNGGGPGGTAPPTLDATATTAAEQRLTTDTATLTTALQGYVSFVESTCTTSATTAAGQPCDPGAAATACPDPTVTPTTLAEAKGCVATAQSAIATDASALSTAATSDVDRYLAAAKAYAAGLAAAGTAQGKAAAAQLIAAAHAQAQQLLAQAKKESSSASSNASSTFSGSSSSGGSTSTASREASDESAIAAAKASLVSARAAAAAATLRSPIAGRVVAVDVVKGDSVSTSSTAVTVLGPGSTTVTSTVALADVPQVKKGESVDVVPAGWTSTLHGTVSSVGLVATTTTSGTTTYPVTVTIEGSPSVPLGTTASLSIVTGTAEDAVTVPTSALTMGTRDSVVVLDQGKATTEAVTVGLVGTTRTTISSGLKAGQRVVLAQITASLPSSDSSTTTRRGLSTGLGGGFSGFGGGSGGFSPPSGFSGGGFGGRG